MTFITQACAAAHCRQLGKAFSHCLVSGSYPDKSRDRKLTFAAFLARLDDADVPGLIFGMEGAEPPPADTAADGSSGVARFSHRRDGLT